MIHEVKIWRPGGDVKIIPGHELTSRYWDRFTADGDLSANVARGIKTSPKKKKALPKKKTPAEPKICVVCKAEFLPSSPCKKTCTEVCRKNRAAEYGKTRYDMMKAGTFVPTRTYQKRL